MIRDQHMTDHFITLDGVRYRFAWQCSFMGELDYMVQVGNMPEKRCTLRHSLGDYERSILNYSVEDIVTQVEGAIGILKDCDPPTVAAFNAWRKREHDAVIAFMKARPERYGDISDLEADKPEARAGKFNLETRKWEAWEYA